MINTDADKSKLAGRICDDIYTIIWGPLIQGYNAESHSSPIKISSNNCH